MASTTTGQTVTRGSSIPASARTISSWWWSLRSSSATIGPVSTSTARTALALEQFAQLAPGVLRELLATAVDEADEGPQPLQRRCLLAGFLGQAADGVANHFGLRLSALQRQPLEDRFCLDVQ